MKKMMVASQEGSLSCASRNLRLPNVLEIDADFMVAVAADANSLAAYQFECCCLLALCLKVLAEFPAVFPAEIQDGIPVSGCTNQVWKSKYQQQDVTPVSGCTNQVWKSKYQVSEKISEKLCSIGQKHYTYIHTYIHIIYIWCIYGVLAGKSPNIRCMYKFLVNLTYEE